MTKEKVKVKWLENMAFSADVSGHELIMDASDKGGGQDRGPRPKPLILVSLAGCTGMDVVSILKKMRVEIDGFNVVVEGEVTEEHPKHFTGMHVIYEFIGKDLPLEKLQKAVSLSEERYCGVSATLRKALGLTSEIKIIEK